MTTLGEALNGIGNLKTGPFGTTLSASEYRSEGAPVISVGEIGDGYLRVRDETPRVPGTVQERLAEYLLQPGDIIFARKGAVDRTAWVRRHEAGFFLGSDGLRLRVPESISSRFLAFALRAPLVRSWLLQNAGGSTLLSLNQQTISRIPLTLPDLRTQTAIAEVLGSLDDKTAANERVVELLDELAMTATTHALEESHVEPLGTFAALTMGSSPKGETLNENGEGVVFHQGVRDFGTRHPQDRVYTTAPLRLAEAGDVLISVRAPVGQLNRAVKDLCIGRGLAAARSARCTGSVLFHLLKAAPGLWDTHSSDGTLFASMSRGQLEGLPLLIPEDLDRLQRQLDPLEQRLESALNENRALAATRDALLPALMSGELSVREVAEASGR